MEKGFQPPILNRSDLFIRPIQTELLKLVTHWVTYLNKRQLELQIHSLFYERLLAEAFYLKGDIEKYGTGFIRIP